MIIIKIYKYIILFVTIIIIDYIKFTLPFGRANAFIMALLFGAEALFTAAMVVYGVFMALRHKKIFFIISSVCLLLILYVFPYTKFYARAYIFIHQNIRQQAIDFLKSDEAKSCQTSENTFLLPMRFRFASHSANAIVKKDKEEVIFYIHCGFFKRSLAVYSYTDKKLLRSETLRW